MAAVLLAALLALLALTGQLASRFAARQRALAGEWSRAGQAALLAGRPAEAVLAFRNALLYARGDEATQRRLAEALLAAGRVDEARAYLERLWQTAPGDGDVNLELARVAARRGEVEEAVRHYEGAIQGVWPAVPAARRRQAREEVADLLLARGRREQAVGHLIALAAELPPDPVLRIRTGRRFLEAGDPGRALEQFHEALRLSRRSRDAHLGAGEASFALGRYGDARAHLEAGGARAAGGRPADLLELAVLAEDSDPYRPGLSAGERVRRAAAARKAAEERRAACPALPAGPSPPARGAPSWERVDADAAFAFAVETAARDCASPRPVDRALVLLAERRRAAEPEGAR